MSKRDRYKTLFGEFGASLSDANWVGWANDSLPPNLSALNARIVADASPKCSIKRRRTAAPS
jgi:hypothetical protein